jgi:hypothetical protein
MSRETMELCSRVARGDRDPDGRHHRRRARAEPALPLARGASARLGRHVIDRCNLTILETRPHARPAGVPRGARVEVVCSLPHYRRQHRPQRGDGVFEKSIAALRA